MAHHSRVRGQPPPHSLSSSWERNLGHGVDRVILFNSFSIFHERYLAIDGGIYFMFRKMRNIIGCGFLELWLLIDWLTGWFARMHIIIYIAIMCHLVLPTFDLFCILKGSNINKIVMFQVMNEYYQKFKIKDEFFPELKLLLLIPVFCIE